MIHIAQRFFEFDQLLSAHPVGSGNINDTYQLQLEQDGKVRSVLLQRLNHQIFKHPQDVMNNTLAVCQHLASSPYPYQIAMPLPGLDGQFLQRDSSGNYWRVFSFIEASYAPEGVEDPRIAYEAARAYGAFARSLQTFPASDLIETIPGFHDTDQRWQVFLKVLKEDPAQRVAAAESEIQRMFRAKPVFDKISQLKKSGALPVRVAHNDTKAGNVLFDQNTHKALAVIDLDTVMPGTLLSDFGDMVRTFVPDRNEDAKSAPLLRSEVLDALTRGFLEETEGFLSQTEKEYLMLGAAWIVGEQALRFLTDWLAGDVYYKIKYPEHNWDRAINQLALFQVINT